MAPWLSIIKVVLPYLGPIVQAAVPAFTKKTSDRTDPLVAQQIGELQSAVKAHSEYTKALAKAMEQAAEANDRSIRRAHLLAFLAAGVAAVALIVATLALLR